MFVILDDNVGFVPNVGIVVGDRATLIVDTGMGPDNGAIVLAEARKLSDNTEFYLTATHFHPEHDLGATAFPSDAKMIRWRDQQAEVDELGVQTIERFASFSPAVAALVEQGELSRARHGVRRRSDARSRRRARAFVRRRPESHARRHRHVRRGGPRAR